MFTQANKHPAVYTMGFCMVTLQYGKYNGAHCIDQAHEKNNSCVKGDAGAVGLNGTLSPTMVDSV